MSRKREFSRYLWDASADVPYRSKCRFHRRSKSGALPASPEDSECSSEGSGNGELALLNNVSTTADELQEPPALSRELQECALGGTENEPEETEEGDLATGSEGSSDSESDGADSHLRSDSKIRDDELVSFSPFFSFISRACFFSARKGVLYSYDLRVVRFFFHSVNLEPQR